MKLFNVLSEVQDMRNTINFVKDRLIYRSAKLGMSGGNLANFATLGGVTWRGIHFSRFSLWLSLCWPRFLLISKK